MAKKIEIEVNAELANQAAEVLERLGLDLEDATKLFLRRCVIEQKLPFDINVTAPEQTSPVQDKGFVQSGKKITQDMVTSVWDAFEEYLSDGGDLRRIADSISDDTGMNAGSAFIYLVIIDNLVKGQRNTRNMKMRDLEFYVDCIKSNLGKDAYKNALRSLEESIPYWKTQALGNFADKVQNYLDEQERQ